MMSIRIPHLRGLIVLSAIASLGLVEIASAQVRLTDSTGNPLPFGSVCSGSATGFGGAIGTSVNDCEDPDGTDTAGGIQISGVFVVDSGSSISLGTNVVHGVGDPTTAFDAVNLQTLDSKIAAANQTQQTQIDQNSDDIDTLQEENATQQGQINQNSSDISALQDENGQQSINIQNNTNTNITQSGQIADLQGDVASLQTVSTGLQSQINQLGERDEELAEGIAIALALEQPILLSGQTFGFRVGYGNFDGESSAGVTAAGVVNRGALGHGSSIVIDGGVGVGGQTGTVAGRGGVTFGW